MAVVAGMPVLKAAPCDPASPPAEAVPSNCAGVGISGRDPNPPEVEAAGANGTLCAVLYGMPGLERLFKNGGLGTLGSWVMLWLAAGAGGADSGMT